MFSAEMPHHRLIMESVAVQTDSAGSGDAEDQLTDDDWSSLEVSCF